ncbi:MAG: sensor histidine kinase [Bacteroidia bacterium]
MKLLNKTNIYTSIVTLLLFSLGIFIMYTVIIQKIDSELDEHLLVNKDQVIAGLRKGKPAVYFYSNIGEKIEIKQIPKQTSFKNVFQNYTTYQKDGDEGEEELNFRKITFQTVVFNEALEISIISSLSERREIGEYISGVILLFLFLALIILFLLNSLISKYIWSPFYKTLAKIKKCKVEENKLLVLEKTNIVEFSELNTTLNNFIQKIQEDYTNLKEFTENISHETQTPVAVISAKIEMLMQENYSPKQQGMLVEAYKAVQRLKKLNETIVMLTRIENSQYVDFEIINLQDAINEKLTELDDFIKAKNISTAVIGVKPVQKKLNPLLLNILLNNLLINAVKHNLPENGYIKIKLNENGFTIENSGASGKIDKENIFEKFKRYTTIEDSIGLGLSIIKKITDSLNWHIKYEYKNGAHIFEITWLN